MRYDGPFCPLSQYTLNFDDNENYVIWGAAPIVEETPTNRRCASKDAHKRTPRHAAQASAAELRGKELSKQPSPLRARLMMSK